MRWRRLAFAGVGLLVALELGLRFGLGLGDPPLVVRDTEVEYRLLPSASYRRFGNRIEINRFGMRGPDHAASAGETERRVLLIGDSVVYGNHSLDQPDTIGVQLTDHLAALPPLAGCTPLAMAAAASSWGPVNQAAFLADIGLLETDLALLLVSAHDLYDTPSGDGFLIPYRLRPSYGALDDAGQIVIERLKRRLVPGPPAQPIELRRQATLAALDRIEAQMARNGVPLILVYHPTVPERQDGLRGEAEVFAHWAQRRGVTFKTLDQEDLKAPGAYRDHIHPAAPGAKRIARHLAHVSAAYLLPCDSPD